MAAVLQEQEARREHLSGATGGTAIEVTEDLTNAADVATLHHVEVAGVVDSIWLQAWNSSAASVDLNLVLAPADTTDLPSMALATVTVTIPAKDSLWVLQGEAFRTRGQSYVLAAYVGAGQSIKCTGYVVRCKGALLY